MRVSFTCPALSVELSSFSTHMGLVLLAPHKVPITYLIGTILLAPLMGPKSLDNSTESAEQVLKIFDVVRKN